LDAFGLGATTTALVGAGGKTSALFRLARAYREPVFLANSAHLGLDQVRLAERSYRISSEADFPDFSGGVPAGCSLFHGPEVPGRGRVSGLDENSLEHLHQLAGYFAVPFLIEADGSRGLPLKAPASHEPPIPAFADAVVVCAGLNGLGLPLDENSVFRSEIFAALSGLDIGQPVSVEALAKVLRSPLGGLKNIPSGARRLVLLNQADTPALQTQAARLAELLLPEVSRVVCAALHGPGPGTEPEVRAVFSAIAGIVLAAGGSSRLGHPKQLLEWQGETLVRRAARVALDGGFAPVLVVVGAEAERVSAALEGLDVRVAFCSGWAAGQSASVKRGLEAALGLRPDLGGAAFLLCDQPFIEAGMLRQLRQLHAQTLAPAAAPRVDNRRANPVLFDRRLFEELAKLEGDSGGRQVLAGHEMAFLDWPDGRILEDIDTFEDYGRLGGLSQSGPG
jgi:molybdenum cofactor cytidylyltransferase